MLEPRPSQSFDVPISPFFIRIDDHLDNADYSGEVKHNSPPDEKGLSGQQLNNIDLDRQLTVEFTDLCCWVPSTIMPPSLFSKLYSKLSKKPNSNECANTNNDSGNTTSPPSSSSPSNTKQILYNITGSASPGEMLALMGPSGSGKTTLLSIIGGRTPKQAIQQGTITFNGSKLSKRIKRQIGYVLQDDLMYETLTCYETLYFAAMLRLPSYMSKAERIERVNTVIASLGLNKCRDTIIGGHMRRGISGGERKRVSVGHELLIDPALVLLDEPTSGLDSTAARNLLLLLKSLASGGRAIITTIHQPSSRLFQQLDTVLLLTQGHIIYYGDGIATAHWFGALGCPVPFGVNIADFMLDIASGEVPLATMIKDKNGDENKNNNDSDDSGGWSDGERGQQARLKLVKQAKKFLTQHPEGYRATYANDGTMPDLNSVSMDDNDNLVVAAGSGFYSSDTIITKNHSSSSMNGSRKPSNMKAMRSATSMAASRPGASRWGASYWGQYSALFVRAVRVRRFESMTLQDMFLFVTVGLICGMIWWQVGRSDVVEPAQQALGLLFFESLFLAFRTMFNSLFTFPSEHKFMLKERSSGMYRLSAYYLARTTSDVFMDLAVPSLMVVILYLMAGLRSGWYFFANWAAVMLTTLVAQGFGLFVGATVMNAKSAQTIASVIMLSFMLVGGFYVQDIPSWISWLKWLSFMTYSYNLLAKIEFGGRVLYFCADGENPADPANTLTCVEAEDTQKALNLFINPNGPVWEVGVLFGYLIVARISVYVALRVKTSAGGPRGRG
jgi:ABC-type multidrug transport system ATPase subunit